MMNSDRLVAGILGTVVSITGTAMSATEVQAIISSIITVLGFIFGVIVPSICRIVKKVRDAKKDGKITREETDDIIKTIDEASKEIVDNLPKTEDNKPNE